MSRVLQAVDSIHTVGLYCLALVPHNHLPKTPLGGIHLSETKKRFLEGTLHPVNVLMCPHTCVTNLPKPREIHTDVGPASVIVGNLVQVKKYSSTNHYKLFLIVVQMFLYEKWSTNTFSINKFVCGSSILLAAVPLVSRGSVF